MRFLVCLSLCILVGLTNAAPYDESDNPPTKPYYSLDNAECEFEAFVEKYNKQYKDEADRQVHYEEFVKSLAEVIQLNSQEGNTAVFDINEFSDYTPEERKRMRGLGTN